MSLRPPPPGLGAFRGIRSLLRAGASGFGLGSALYKPGQDAAATRSHADAFVNGWRLALKGVTR